MARRVAAPKNIDDSGELEPVYFSWAGVAYQLNLSPAGRAALEEKLARYLNAAIRTSGPKRRRPAARSQPAGPPQASAPAASKQSRPTKQPRPKPEPAAVRAWAVDNGLKVSPRGRISAELLAEYESALG